MSEKLQKVLARAGFGSRREMERWIEAGRVSINGKIVGLGERVTEDDIVRVDGTIVAKQKMQQNRRCRVLVYNKPEGEVTSQGDPEGRKTVFDRDTIGLDTCDFTGIPMDRGTLGVFAGRPQHKPVCVGAGTDQCTAHTAGGTRNRYSDHVYSIPWSGAQQIGLAG